MTQLATTAMDFERAASFSDLLEANVRYLRGELLGSPYHGGPPAPETAPLLAPLERLQTHSRLFTFESQPGLHEQTHWCEPCESSGGVHGGGTCSGGRYVETQQRAYVDLFAEASTLPALLAQLRLHSHSFFFLLDYPGRPDLFQHNVPAAAAWSDAQGGPHLNLTRERRAPTRNALPAAPWALHTNAKLRPGWADAELAALGQRNPRMAAVLAECVLVGVMARRYGHCQPSPLDMLLLR